MAGVTAVVNGSDPFAMIKIPDIRTTPVGAADGKAKTLLLLYGSIASYGEAYSNLQYEP